MREKKVFFLITFIFIFIIIGCKYDIAQSGQSVELLLNAGKDSYYQGKLSEAREFYLEVLTKEANNLIALQNIYSINRELGDLKGALSYNQRLVNLMPDNLKLKYEEGLILFQLGRYKEAEDSLINVYNQIVRLKEEDGDTPVFTGREESLFYYYLGQTAERVGKEEQARLFYQLGINTAPYLSLNYLGLARLYQRENRIEELISAYSEALGKDASLSFLFPELARNYELLEEIEAAYYYWKKSLETGVKIDLAEEKLAKLTGDYPELIVRAEVEKEKIRGEISWVSVKPLRNVHIPLIRVGLLNNIDSVSFQAGAPFEVLKGDLVMLTGEAREEWVIRAEKAGYGFYKGEELIKRFNTEEPLILRLTDDTCTFIIYDISYGTGYFWAGSEDRQYRGKLEIYPVDEKSFNIINLINVEEYLFSVVPSEMPAWWPEEALKAQAIAARSYVFAHLGRHAKSGYDLCDTVHCAAYNGVGSEHSRTNQAVLSTLGEVCYYQDSVVDAVYSSNSGGYSESSEDVWGHSYPYLTGVSSMLEDGFDFPLEPYQVREWLINESDSYSGIPLYAGFNKYRWIKIMPVEYILDKYHLQELKNILPQGRSKGGSIDKILIQGKEKEITLKRDSIRSGLGDLRSNRFIMDKIYSVDGIIEQIIFYGSGWGHNVGMDQTGAAGMAEDGYTYQDIINHYYQGTEIKKKY